MAYVVIIFAALDNIGFSMDFILVRIGLFQNINNLTLSNMSKTRVFYEAEKARQTSLIEEGFFGPSEKGNGDFKGEFYPFVLQQNNGVFNNLYEPIRGLALSYFDENKISWWGGKLPTGHVLSSQIACVNHLMALRKDPVAVLALINGVRNQFKEVLPLPCDKDESYIAFEAVSKLQHLNEDGLTRGSNCTSVDALVYAVDSKDERWIIPIEWKYTESYDDCRSSDKSTEGITYGIEPNSGKKPKGEVRLERYSKLIEESEQLRSIPAFVDASTYELRGSIYFYEPFYQLMRQTLWAEQMIKHRDIEAKHYMHIHIIPANDTDLLDKKYRPSKGNNMEDTWRACIVDQSKYVIVDPQQFMSPIKDMHPELWDYLSRRYFNI